MEKKCCICGGKYHAKGYCEKHYLQMKRHGKILDRTIYDKNEWKMYDDYAECVTYDKYGNNNGLVKVDLEDFEKLRDYKVYLRESINGKKYAMLSCKSHKYFVHRFVLGISKEKYDSSCNSVDHLNGDSLDNRKCNLRICSQNENMKNIKKKNKIIGVTYLTNGAYGKNYVSNICFDYKNKYLGRYYTFEEAVYARLKSEFDIFGNNGSNSEYIYVLDSENPIEEIRKLLQDGSIIDCGTKEKKEIANEFLVRYRNRTKSKTKKRLDGKKCCVCGNDAKHSFIDGNFYCGRHYQQLRINGKILDNTYKDNNVWKYYDDYAECEIYDSNKNIIGKMKVDLDDVDKLNKNRIYATSKNKQGKRYALVTKNGKKTLVHRFILNIEENGYDCYLNVVDHLNNDTFDNRKKNLRICSQNENTKNGSSINGKVVGVKFSKETNKYCSYIINNYKYYMLGYFNNYSDAILARLKKENELHKGVGPNKCFFYILELNNPIDELERLIKCGNIKKL